MCIPPFSKRAFKPLRVRLKYYKSLWKKLQKEGRSNSIKNEFLDVDIYIVEKESDKKTAREALHNWKSTYAVKHLDTVIKKARPAKGYPMFASRKEGEQKRNGYKNMILLYYNFIDEEKEYLNFRVKLTIGVMTDGKHVQYCVNKIEAK